MALKESGKQFSIPDEGIVPARLARIVEIGEHDTQYGVKDQLFFFYSLPTRLIEDEGDYFGKQHMIRSKPMKNSDSEKAALYEHRKVLGMERDLSMLLTRPSFLTVTHNDVDSGGSIRTFANITNISGVPEGMTVPELDTKPFYFDFDNPDPEVWEQLGEWIQDKIKEALNYPGSNVEKLVAHLAAMNPDTQDSEE